MSTTDEPLDSVLEAGLDRLVAFYETLTPASLEQLATVYAPQAHFKDPFNEVVGLAAIEAIFRHMFAQVQSPQFTVTARLRDGPQVMLGWVFAFGSPQRRIEVRGVSHLQLDRQGRVVVHRDYWDTAEELYAKLPLLGVLMRGLRRRLSATQR
ncbi:isomerase [Zoogloeaceae bacteirum Par-f-2]|nr:isomerase [Zoogloeaceae bacteirum Par-f-2]